MVWTDIWTAKDAKVGDSELCVLRVLCGPRKSVSIHTLDVTDPRVEQSPRAHRGRSKLLGLIGLAVSALIPLSHPLAQDSVTYSGTYSGSFSRLPKIGSVSSWPSTSEELLRLNAHSYLLGNVSLTLQKISERKSPLQYVDTGSALVLEPDSPMTLLRGFAMVKKRGSVSEPRNQRLERIPVSGALVTKGGVSLLRFRLKPTPGSPQDGNFSRAWRVHQFEVFGYEGRREGKATARVRSVSSRALGARTCLAANPPVAALARAAQQSDPRTLAGPHTLALEGLTTTRALEVITDCDAECSQELGASQANDRIAEYFNDVNTIYPEQLGLTLVVKKQVRRTSSTVYPSSLTDSLSLLQRFRSIGTALGAADAKHLITGKSLDDDVLGLAYVETVCRPGEFTAYGLTSRSGDLLTPIIIAHEIGHNLGASHDTVTGGIMSPRLGSPLPASFSTFSKNQISDYITQFATQCLSEMLPQTEFSVSYRRQRLRASLAVPEGYANCTVRLNAGVSKALQKTLLFEQFVDSIDTRISIEIDEVKRVNPSGSSPTKVFLLPSATCETGGELSGPLRAITVSATRRSASGLAEAKGWVRAVRRRLGQS